MRKKFLRKHFNGIQILNTYEAMSVQVVNRAKTSILYNKNTMRRGKEELMNILGL
jgi:hypothetical protein